MIQSQFSQATLVSKNRTLSIVRLHLKLQTHIHDVIFAVTYRDETINQFAFFSPINQHSTISHSE